MHLFLSHGGGPWTDSLSGFLSLKLPPPPCAVLGPNSRVSITLTLESDVVFQVGIPLVNLAGSDGLKQAPRVQSHMDTTPSPWTRLEMLVSLKIGTPKSP